MPLLHAGRHGGWHEQRDVAEAFRFAAVSSEEAHRHQPLALRGLERFKDVCAVAARGEADEHVAGVAERFDLAGKDLMEGVVVSFSLIKSS